MHTYTFLNPAGCIPVPMRFPAASFFLLLAYWGYKKNYMLIVIGLALHGLWDILFPHLSAAAPFGYDIFCLTIDVLLAMYFYLKLKPIKIAQIFTRRRMHMQ